MPRSQGRQLVIQLGLGLVRQNFDANVPEPDFTDVAWHRRVSLESEGALG